MKRFLTILSAAALLLSCQREEFPGGNDPSRRIVTSEAASVTETSAVLKGYANLPDDGTYYRYGIVVSTDKTPTADNLVYQNFPAMILGFPIMLLATLAPKKPWLVLLIACGLFLVMNLILFRSYIFKRKEKK